MLNINHAIPSAEILIALEPEELGAKLLFLIRQEHGDAMFHPGQLDSELYASHANVEGYPRAQQDEVQEAITEALAWLEAQGFVVRQSGTNGDNGWKRLSRRARRIEDEGEFRAFASAASLPKDILHPSIARKVWLDFVRGDFDVAVFHAMKQVEISVRDACEYGDDAYGADMMRAAFHVKNGPLTDMSVMKAEREALSHLFAGAIGTYKNPQSHRDVNLDNPAEAIELILIANHLLRIVDSRAAQPAPEERDDQ